MRRNRAGAMKAVVRLPTQTVPQVEDHPGTAWIDTCDAGDCDEETLAVVLTDDGRWLSMCSTHAIGALGGYTQGDVEAMGEA